MMFGPSFGDEVVVAGLAGLPFSWSADGAVHGRENLTPEQVAALDAVIAAHDPSSRAPTSIAAQIREIEGRQNSALREALLHMAANGASLPAELLSRLQSYEDEISSLRSML